MSEPAVQYAVKKYNIKEIKGGFRNVPEIILNEINFMRELKVCDNIAQIEEVYLEATQICMVMKYARHGTLLKYLQKRKRFSEEQIRSIMT